MKTLKKMKLSLVLVPVISIFSFVTIITAAPTKITEKMNSQEIETIAVVSLEAKNNASAQPALAPQAVVSPAAPDPATPNPSTAPTNSTSTSVKKVQPQTSRASNTPIKATTVKPSSAQTKASAIIATGKQYIGVNYVYGGTTPAGFDCSGFTQYVLAKHGINLPRVSRDQFKVGTSVSFNNLQPGDLVFFSLAKNGVVDHVGIFVGNGQFINSASSKGVTIYTLGPYWKSAFVGAKRVL